MTECFLRRARPATRTILLWVPSSSTHSPAPALSCTVRFRRASCSTARVTSLVSTSRRIAIVLSRAGRVREIHRTLARLSALQRSQQVVGVRQVDSRALFGGIV